MKHTLVATPFNETFSFSLGVATQSNHSTYYPEIIKVQGEDVLKPVNWGVISNPEGDGIVVATLDYKGKPIWKSRRINFANHSMVFDLDDKSILLDPFLQDHSGWRQELATTHPKEMNNLLRANVLM